MLLVFENFGEKTPRNTKLKIFLRSRHKKNSRTLWRLTRTPNLKFLENQTKIFEKHRKINKKTPNLKFGTWFNRKIIFEKGFKKYDSQLPWTWTPRSN